jgi:hypothetical protein
MSKIKIFTILSCLLLLAAMVFPCTVFAAVAMSPSQGIVGSSVSISGLTPSQTYTIKWDGSSLVAGTVSASGAVSLYVPEDNGGIHTIVVENPTGNTVLTESYTLIPSITIDPSQGFVGTAISVTGRGFTSEEEEIEILYDDDVVKEKITADSDGSWTASFDAPASTTGSHDVDALGEDTTASSVSDASFTVEPKISISPTSCGVGCLVTVTGTGFEQSETGIKVSFSGDDIKTGISATSKGSWSTSFNVPVIHSGEHTVDAYGSETSTGDIDDLIFQVTSGIALDKKSVYVGDVIAITGTGFAADESNIYITMDGVNQGSSVSADSDGQWTSALSVPPAVNGSHIIDAHGGSTTASNIADETITVNARIVISPSSGNVGDQISITGNGFSGNSMVNVEFGTVSVLTNVSTDATGNFSASFDAPKGISGDLEIVASDTGSVAANAPFAMDKTAPDPPLVETPADGDIVGIIGDTRVTFKWKGVDDPSGVTYDIQVATDSSFGGIALEHTGLTTTEYKSMSDEALPPGEYYWRVRATDEAANIGDWSLTTNFKAGFMSITTAIIIVVVIILVIVAIVRIRVVFFKKRNQSSS